MVTLLKSTNGMITDMKKCRKCKKNKEISEFGPWKYSKDRKAYCCRECEKLRARKEREECPERNRVRCTKSYRKHAAERKVSVKLWEQKNPEKARATSQRYYKNHAKELRENYGEHAAEIKQSDRYIRILMRSKYKITDELISEDMVERERALIKIKRTFWRLKNGKSKADRRGNVATSTDEELRNLFGLLS